MGAFRLFDRPFPYALGAFPLTLGHFVPKFLQSSEAKPLQVLFHVLQIQLYRFIYRLSRSRERKIRLHGKIPCKRVK